MRNLLSILILVLWASVASAGPMLVCDPDPNCETYNVYVDDVLIAEDLPAPLNYDLEGMEPGTFAFDAECCNYWGCEMTVDPYISLDGPGIPLNLGMGL